MKWLVCVWSQWVLLSVCEVCACMLLCSCHHWCWLVRSVYGDVCVWHSYAWSACVWNAAPGCVLVDLFVGFGVWWYLSDSVCMSACVCRGNVPAFTLCQRKGSFWLQWGSHQETPRHQPWPYSQVRTQTHNKLLTKLFTLLYGLQ